MQSRTLTILIACVTFAAAFPQRAGAAAEADLPKLIADAAKYQSGQNLEPIQRIEQLLRDSAGKPALRGELESAMLKLLASDAAFEAQRFACQILAVVGTDASLPTLARLLAGEETAGIACLALTGRRSPKVAETLRNALRAARGRTRVQLIVALGNHQDPQSVTTLAELARNADAAVAGAAILSLGKIGTRPAHEAVAALRREAKPAQACVVAEATLLVAEQLAGAGDRKGASALYAELLQPSSPTNIRRGAFAALAALDKDGGEQRIVEAIGGRDRVLLPVAIARVASLKSEGASKKFAAMLPGLSPSAQAWMVEALAGRGDAAARLAIRAQAASPEAAVRRAAILAVGRLEDASAVPLLAKNLALLKSADELQEIEHALAGLRGGAATDAALLAELKRSSPEVKVRLFSVFARRGARAAVPALLAEAGGSDIATVRAALQSLGRIGTGDDLPALLEKLVSLRAADARADAELAAARVMTRIADVGRRSETLRATLTKTSDVEARCSLLRLLPSGADASALAALKAAGEDKEAVVRDTAVRALTTWPDASAWDPLLAVFGRPEKSTHRALALRGLVRLAGDLNANPDAALIDRYRQLLAGARSDDERKLILGALAGAAHPDALQLAVGLLAHAGVRAEAELAIKKIAAAVKAQHPQAAQDALRRLKRAKP